MSLRLIQTAPDALFCLSTGITITLQTEPEGEDKKFYRARIISTHPAGQMGHYTTLALEKPGSNDFFVKKTWEYLLSQCERHIRYQEE